LAGEDAMADSVGSRWRMADLEFRFTAPLEAAPGCADPGFGAQRARWGTVSCTEPLT